MPLVRGQKRRAEPDPEESPEESPEPATQRRRTQNVEEEGYGSDPGYGANDSNSQMVKKMVRLALACEYQRKPIRRVEVGEKVLGTNSRQFKAVFEEAQIQLRHTFGMEMVELPAKEKVTVREKRAQKSQASKPTPSWILTSVLPTAFNSPEIMVPPAAPTAKDDSEYTATYTLLVSLIRLSGGSLPEAKMERYLRRLGMEDNTPIASYTKTELLLKRMEKDGYLVKVKENATGQDEDISWSVGPRGKVEVGNRGVRGLVGQVYGDLDAEEAKELKRRAVRSLGEGERPPEKKADAAGGEKKKRGRKRRDEEKDEEEGDEEDDE